MITPKPESLFSNAKFIVVADVKLTETARVADVVLPLGGFACGSGSFTNVFGTSQTLQKAIDGYDDYHTAKTLSEALQSKPGQKRTCAALLNSTEVIVNGADALEL